MQHFDFYNQMSEKDFHKFNHSLTMLPKKYIKHISKDIDHKRGNKAVMYFYKPGWKILIHIPFGGHPRQTRRAIKVISREIVKTNVEMVSCSGMKEPKPYVTVSYINGKKKKVFY